MDAEETLAWRLVTASPLVVIIILEHPVAWIGIGDVPSTPFIVSNNAYR